MRRFIWQEDFSPELEIKASRSSGPGGQNVNKVSTRIELRFDIPNSSLLSEDEKEKLIRHTGKRTSKEGVLIIVAQSSRSQLQNKEEAINKFYEILEKAFKPVRRRIPTAPSYSAVRKRLEDKRKHSERKLRRLDKPDFE
jgi:ribosome-associated protein